MSSVDWWARHCDGFVAARGSSKWDSWIRSEAPTVLAAWKTLTQAEIAWFAGALADERRKWFVAFLANESKKAMPPALRAPMLRAAIHEPSFNHSFVDPCVRAFGVASTLSALHDMNVSDEEQDGMAKALASAEQTDFGP